MREIEMEKRLGLLPKAAVFAVLSAFLVGCPSKKEPPPDPSSPESYMNDTNFMGRLSGERAKHVALMRERNAIAEKMKDMVEAKKAEMKTEDLAAVEAELKKDPVWNDLYTQITNANAKVEAHRREQLGIVRERITPRRPSTGKPISN